MFWLFVITLLPLIPIAYILSTPITTFHKLESLGLNYFYIEKAMNSRKESHYYKEDKTFYLYEEGDLIDNTLLLIKTIREESGMSVEKILKEAKVNFVGRYIFSNAHKDI